MRILVFLAFLFSAVSAYALGVDTAPEAGGGVTAIPPNANYTLDPEVVEMAAQAQESVVVTFPPTPCAETVNDDCTVEFEPGVVTVGNLRAYWQSQMGSAPPPAFPADANQKLSTMAGKILQRAALRSDGKPVALVMVQRSGVIAIVFGLRLEDGRVEMTPNLAPVFRGGL